MRTIKLNVLSLFLAVISYSKIADCQNWSTPIELPGFNTDVTGVNGNVFTDRNGNLNFGIEYINAASEDNRRATYQMLLSNNQLTSPLSPPRLPKLGDTIDTQSGFAYIVAQNVTGNRVVVYTSQYYGNSSAMTLQRVDGTFGPNSVNLGYAPIAVAYRKDMVVILRNASSNGGITLEEYKIDNNGVIAHSKSTNFSNTSMLYSLYGCGGALTIEADGTVRGIILTTNPEKTISTITRDLSGIWKIEKVIDKAVFGGDVKLQCLQAAASPGGRIVAAWATKEGGRNRFIKDEGGEIRAIVKEPGQPFPDTYKVLLSKPKIIGTKDRYRDFALNVAIGLDNTIGVITHTQFCQGGGISFASEGALFIAKSNEDFLNARKYDLTELATTPDKVIIPAGAERNIGDSTLHLGSLAGGFAVENGRAVMSFKSITGKDIGTDIGEYCSNLGKPLPDFYKKEITIAYYDGNIITNEIINTQISDKLNPANKGDMNFRNTIAASMDAKGNAVILRSDRQQGIKNSDFRLFGTWKSGEDFTIHQDVVGSVDNKPNNPNQPGIPSVDTENFLKDFVDIMISLVKEAKKPFPTGIDNKSKAKKKLISEARKNLKAKIKEVSDYLKTNEEAATREFPNFTLKNLKTTQSLFGQATSSKIKAVDQKIAWKLLLSSLKKLIK